MSASLVGSEMCIRDSRLAIRRCCTLRRRPRRLCQPLRALPCRVCKPPGRPGRGLRPLRAGCPRLRRLQVCRPMAARLCRLALDAGNSEGGAEAEAVLAGGV
eukprot:7237375-Alexandrium_andersonii.AAC.2